MSADYWKEHAEIAMDEAGISATEAQLDTIAGVIESAHEFYGQSMGHDVASANLKATRDGELEKAKRELETERNKVTCPGCKGTGAIVVGVGFRSSFSQCSTCRGDGRI